jgi:hypothetical protein
LEKLVFYIFVLIPAPEHPVPPESERSFSMKAKKTLFGFAALFLAAVFSLTCLACKNDDDDSSSGGGKPAHLADNATLQQAKDKCDEIIAYCDNHSNATNNGIKSSVSTLKTSSLAYLTDSTWTGSKSTIISTINTSYIDNLQ